MIRLILIALLSAVPAAASQWASGDPAEGVPPVSNGADDLGSKSVGETFVINHDFDKGTFEEVCAVSSVVYYEEGRYDLVNVQFSFGGVTTTLGQPGDPGRCREDSPPSDGTHGEACDLAFSQSTVGMTNPVCRNCIFFEQPGLASSELLQETFAPSNPPEIRYTFEVVGTVGLPEIRFLDQKSRFISTAGSAPPLGWCLDVTAEAPTDPQGQVIQLPEPRYGLLFGILGLLALGGKRNAV